MSTGANKPEHTEQGIEPVGALRGAGVDVDIRRVGRIAVALVLLSLVVLAAALFVVGAHKNAQINRLRQDGVPVEVTVSGCLGLLGGSGSNPAGFACKGTFTVHGQHYDGAIPGNTFYRPGTTLRAVSVPGDPALFSTAAIVDSEHASARVFIVPTILVVVLALLVGGLVLRRQVGGV